MEIIKLFPDTQIEMKKPHPCGSRIFRVIRVGSICRIACCGCGRDMDIDRIKLERAIKNVLGKQEAP